MTSVWKSFGATLVGPGHVAVCMPNQDAWAAFQRIWGDGIVVSDGLGSKPFSNIGSWAVCGAVPGAVGASLIETRLGAPTLCEEIKGRWLRNIAPLDPGDCAATCLYALRMNNGIVHLGMLGDGLAAAVKTDGSVVLVSDDKTDSFSNITAAMSPTVTEEDWRRISLPETECRSLFLCTDGVADDLIDAEGFVSAFVDAHCDSSAATAPGRILELFRHWPTPKHSDDKTIACLFREDPADG